MFEQNIKSISQNSNGSSVLTTQLHFIQCFNLFEEGKKKTQTKRDRERAIEKMNDFHLLISEWMVANLIERFVDWKRFPSHFESLRIWDLVTGRFSSRKRCLFTVIGINHSYRSQIACCCFDFSNGSTDIRAAHEHDF